MGLLIKLRNILIIVKLFYWLTFKATIKAIANRKVSMAHQFWAQYAMEYFQVKLKKSANSKQMGRQKMVLLTNHRTQADFFIHTFITENNASFLSRLLVAFVFFFFSLTATKSVWFFNRSGNIDPQKFNSWLDKKFEQSQRHILLAYPEGHRMGGVDAVNKQTIKTGMIRYAYRRALPVQFLMSFGNQLVFNQKKLSVSWKQTVYYSFSKIISPADFQTQAQFVNGIKEQFAKYFDVVYEEYTKERQSIQNRSEANSEVSQRKLQ